VSLNRVPALIGWGKGRNVTYAGWQVTLCDPIWHVSFRSGAVLVAQTATRFLTFLTLPYKVTDATDHYTHGLTAIVWLNDSRSVLCWQLWCGTSAIGETKMPSLQNQQKLLQLIIHACSYNAAQIMPLWEVVSLHFL